jgi:parallel beta-helix repeat protein
MASASLAQTSIPFLKAYEAHFPIVINSNDDFAAWDFSGSGTNGDPYIIEDLNITADGYCISISATSAFFVIRDCYFKSVHYSAAIRFNQVAFGRVERCKIVQSGEGLWLIQSSDCTIDNITVHSCQRGVDIDWSHRISISNSNIFGNSYGIDIGWSGNCSIVGNKIYRNVLRGVSLDTNTSSCSIYANSVGWNGEMYPDTLERNAEDFGQDNLWDDNVSTGNYWTDYDGNGPYEIGLGSVSSADRYPHLLSDTTPPAINSPVDVMLEEGSSGANVIWAPRDEFPYEYALYRDGILLITLDWDGEDIEIHVTGAQPGLHNFTLFVYDAFGNVVNDTIIANIMADVFGGAGTELVAAASLVSVVMVAIVLLAVKKMR